MRFFQSDKNEEGKTISLVTKDVDRVAIWPFFMTACETMHCIEKGFNTMGEKSVTSFMNDPKELSFISDVMRMLPIQTLSFCVQTLVKSARSIVP
jgi:hypothetical protein